MTPRPRTKRFDYRYAPTGPRRLSAMTTPEPERVRRPPRAVLVQTRTR